MSSGSLIGSRRGVLPSGTYTAPYPGDLDGNGWSDWFDYSTVRGNFGATHATWEMGDMDGDGTVSWFDYSLVKGNYGQHRAASYNDARYWERPGKGEWLLFRPVPPGRRAGVDRGGRRNWSVRI